MYERSGELCFVHTVRSIGVSTGTDLGITNDRRGSEGECLPIESDEQELSNEQSVGPRTGRRKRSCSQ